MNRDKRLVGIVSLADLALEGSLPKTAKALHGISQPGGQHNQSRPSAEQRIAQRAKSGGPDKASPCFVSLKQERQCGRTSGNASDTYSRSKPAGARDHAALLATVRRWVTC
jgi:hypothetical protein